MYRQFSWPFDFVLDDVFDVHRVLCNALAGTEEKVDDEWDEQFADMALVVLGERAQARAVDDFERKNRK